MSERIKWPNGLPIPKIGGLNGQYQNAVIRTKMDAGPAKQRRRFTAVPKLFSGRLILNEEQRSLLDAFYRNSIGHGTLRFDMKNPQTGQEETFRMTEPYSEDGNDDGLWEITLKFERML